MTDVTQDEDENFFIVEAADPAVRVSTALGDIIDHSVHRIAPPQMSDLWRNLALLPAFLPLFGVLVWRLISTRYTQSFLGLIWVVVQPLAQSAIILFMFTIINVNTSDGAHQGLFLFAGITAWGFFTRGLQDAQGSLQSHAGILQKIYMPKIMLPLASLLATWFDTLIVITLLVVICFVFGVPPTPRLLWLPVFLVLISFASLSVGLGLAPLNALYRDVSVLVSLFLQVVMYMTPVYYATRFIPPKYQLIYHMNPMVSLLEGVRWTILPGSPAPQLKFLLVSAICIIVAMAASLAIYQKLEAVVIDRI
jgi:homopolymeric O-antigen transport system permease protein